MIAEEYAELINKILSSFQYLRNKPHFPYTIEIPQANPSFLRWREKIALRNGIVLKVNEKAVFDGDGMIERSFSYDLRYEDGGPMIWNICNHEKMQPITNPCHIHTDPDDHEVRNEYFEDSTKADFPYVIKCVRKFFEGEPQEWEAKPDDKTK